MPRTTHDHEGDGRLSRRTTLVRAGGLAAAALGAASLPADAVACVLAPEMTDGPYYLPNEKLRRTITEGLPGAPLNLRLTVVDAATCKPIKGAAVDIWHCSAGGKYSGEQDNGTAGLTFLRGIQRTDARGLARFATVYPGWYQGRAVHIHARCTAAATSCTPARCSSATASPTPSTGALPTASARHGTSATRTTRSSGTAGATPC
jgi:protocatechuate 3,4-dioxygenase beta subunit